MGENVLPTHPVAVGQPNVLLVIATLLAFHRPILHPLLPKPQLHSHQLLLRALLVTIASLLFINKGKDCTTVNLASKCTNKSFWINQKFCQLSCYNAGLGYDGDICCNATL